MDFDPETKEIYDIVIMHIETLPKFAFWLDEDTFYLSYSPCKGVHGCYSFRDISYKKAIDSCLKNRI